MRRIYAAGLLIAGFVSTALFSLLGSDSAGSFIYTAPLGGESKSLSPSGNTHNFGGNESLNGVDRNSGKGETLTTNNNPVKIAQATSTNAVIKINGQPFFPFGFYYLSTRGQIHSKRLADLQMIAAAGFNTLHIGLSLSNETVALLAEAAKLGVYTIGEYDDNAMSVINAHKNKPAVLGWNVVDDCNDGGKTVSSISQFSNQVKAAAPQNLTYMTCYDRASTFANLANVFAMQTYPVSGEEISVAGTAIERAVSATAPYGQPAIAILQLFAWQGQRAPTSSELRNMTYQAIIKGAKGIIYYSFYKENWDVGKNPTLWNELKSLAPEIKQLSPFFLNGRFTKVNGGNYHVLAGMWEYQNRRMAIVLNTHQFESRNINLTWPISLRGITRTFSNVPTSLAVNTGKLSGTIQPKAVHIYDLQS